MGLKTMVGASVFGQKAAPENKTATEVAMRQQLGGLFSNGTISNAMAAQQSAMSNALMNSMMNSAQIQANPYVGLSDYQRGPPAPRFQVRTIRNGYILCHAKYDGDVSQEDFCEGMKEVGERVTAVLVQYQLEEKK